MKRRLSHRVPVFFAALIVVLPVTAISAFGPALASGAGSEGPQAASPSGTRTIYIVGGKDNFRFVGPQTVIAGEQLRIVNLTNPRQVGPHTFSLVTPESIPKTARARRFCFAEGHICNAIAGWHGAVGSGAPSQPLVEAGAEGWDTSGSVTQKGDSWFSGEKRGASFVQEVTASTAAGPTTLFFICAIHPWMHGSITVLPPSS